MRQMSRTARRRQRDRNRDPPNCPARDATDHGSESARFWTRSL